MHWLRHSRLKSARAWRLKRTLRDIYQHAGVHSCAEAAGVQPKAWLSWARRFRHESFKEDGGHQRPAL
jgi:transposase-like protein